MGFERKGFEAMGAAAKGRLWARGLSLAEAEIDGGMEPAGRWRIAGAAEASSAEFAEEPGFESVAA